MKRAKIKQFIISFPIIVSLFASSVAACACSHHHEKAEASVPSCHKHSKQERSEQTRDASFESAASEIECICVQFVSKVSAKSSDLKFEKQAAAASIRTTAKITFVQQILSVKIDFAKPLYLSDSFYNLAPGRAPPIL